MSIFICVSLIISMLWGVVNVLMHVHCVLCAWIQSFYSLDCIDNTGHKTKRTKKTKQNTFHVLQHHQRGLFCCRYHWWDRLLQHTRTTLTSVLWKHYFFVGVKHFVPPLHKKEADKGASKRLLAVLITQLIRQHSTWSKIEERFEKK